MEFLQPISQEIFKRKYCLHGEQTPQEVFREVAREIASVEDNPQEWEEEFYEIMDKGEFIPGGRILANARVQSKMKNYNNCFVIPVGDSMESIYTALRQDALIGKMGGGVGFNISSLRPKGARISKGGTSSGPISFLEVFNISAEAIHTGGGRRSAHIVVMNVDHPDIEEFITYKQGDKNGKLKNFNISVGITEDFMQAVISDESWDLVFDGVVFKTVSAVYLYDLIMQNMFEHNEPGVFFLDEVKKYNTGVSLYNIEACNPCFTGDTIVAVADGRNGVSLEELVSEESFPVYSAFFNTKKRRWQTEIKNATAFETGNKEVIQVELSDGSSFRCTPDHKLALKGGGYTQAKDSIGLELGKFYSFSNKNTKKSYRHINSKSDGHKRQYRMLWEFYYGPYGKDYTLDHMDGDSTNDNIDNIRMLEKEIHQRISNNSKRGKNNPIHRIEKERLSILQRHKNVLANAKRYEWSSERTSEALEKLPPIPEEVDKNVSFNKPVSVVNITYTGEVQKVFDLTVEDNHNFFIITKKDDNRYLNSSGVLVHNCGEQPLPDYGCCCLGALNLTAFVRDPFSEDSFFDAFRMREVTRIAVRFLDNVLSTSDYPLPEIREQVLGERRIGLGFTGFADAQAMLGVEYGSDDSKDFSHMIGIDLRNSSYEASIHLAREKGSFPFFTPEMFNDGFLGTLPELLRQGIKQYGLRNIALNTVAPTGTISFSVGQNCSSGIEPIFSLQYDRKIRQEDGSEKTETVFDYAWLKYMDYLMETNQTFTDIPSYFVTTFDIDPYKAIEIQGIIQQYIDASISKTANLPENYTFEDFKDLFMFAWEHKLKGFTSFNPQGSMKGVLTVTKDQSGRIIPKRPKDLPCDIYEIQVNKQRVIALVGIDAQDEPYEIFITHDEDKEIALHGRKQGVIRRIKRGEYHLILNGGGEERVVQVTSTFNKEWLALSRLLSLDLRHKLPLQFVVEDLGKNQEFGTFSKGVARILKKYIKEGIEVEDCPECGQPLQYEEGCKACTCGYSACE